jgi:hypothetical protein
LSVKQEGPNKALERTKDAKFIICLCTVSEYVDEITPTEIQTVFFCVLKIVKLETQRNLEAVLH